MIRRRDFDIAAFRRKLIQWFKCEGRDYPWRRTTDPWHIVVSEFMLQQTTIPTVLNRYEAWMQQFPTPADLAQVNEQVALRSWEGLGYYRRIRSLYAIAKVIVREYDGIFPDTPEQLLQLPGVGKYTVGAILSFAFNKPAPIVDANVARVIARIDNYSRAIDCGAGTHYMWKRAAELLDCHEPRLFNSALMELGQTYCKPQHPDCLLCPVRAFCVAQHPESLPKKTSKTKISALEHHDIIYIQNSTILLARHDFGQRHEGMFRFPQRNKAIVEHLPCIYKQMYQVTRFKITRYIYLATSPISALTGEQFIPITHLNEIPMASPDRKALQTDQIRSLLNL